MDFTEFEGYLLTAFKDNGIENMLTEETKIKFFTFADFLLSENEKYNLTAIKGPDRICTFHFADCALISNLIEGDTLLDVGCGAGFPSIPLAILRPDIKISAIDSTEKKVNFVNSAAKLLSLTNIEAKCKRAEELARTEMRESFDTVTARAVAGLSVLCELCMPLVKVGGKFIAMKGKSANEELKEAGYAIMTLGGKQKSFDNTPLYSFGEKVDRAQIEIIKSAKTPEKYPRPYAKIAKSPIYNN